VLYCFFKNPFYICGVESLTLYTMNATRNTNGRRIQQTVDGINFTWQYDERGNCTRFETSDGYWRLCTFDAKNRLLTFQDVTGFTRFYKYDKFGDMSYKDSTGLRVDKYGNKTFGALK
jgi:YD repeat-containing protein